MLLEHLTWIVCQIINSKFDKCGFHLNLIYHLLVILSENYHYRYTIDLSVKYEIAHPGPAFGVIIIYFGQTINIPVTKTYLLRRETWSVSSQQRDVLCPFFCNGLCAFEKSIIVISAFFHHKIWRRSFRA